MANEKRLIDAYALMDTVEGVNWYHIDKLGYLANGANSQDHTPIYKAEDIYNAIRNAPTVDAVEVVHGEWKDAYEIKSFRRTNPVVQCSKCECYFCDIINNHRWLYHYCPNCGAKMDGGNDDGRK